MTLSEKVAYIKGLCDGLEIDNTTKEGKILAALLDLVDDMAKTVEDHEEAIDEIDGAIDELNDYAEELDEDLAAVEDFLDGECDGDCENCDECDDCEYDCNCEDEDDEEYVKPSSRAAKRSAYDEDEDDGFDEDDFDDYEDDEDDTPIQA